MTIRRNKANRYTDDDDDRPAARSRRDDDDDDAPPPPRKKKKKRVVEESSNQTKLWAGLGTGIAIVLVLVIGGLRIYRRLDAPAKPPAFANVPPPAMPPMPPPPMPDLPNGPRPPVPMAPPMPAEENFSATISNLRVERDIGRKQNLVFEYDVQTANPGVNYCAVVNVPGQAPMIVDLGPLFGRRQDTVAVGYFDPTGSFPKGTTVFLGTRSRSGNAPPPKQISNLLTLR